MTPLQRSARYAGKEFFTDAERAALDKERAGIDLRPRQAGGTERDVAGAYSAVFMSVKPTGRRTSLVVDPPDGRIPPMTAELQKRLDEERAYRLALLQNTATCKNQDPACRGGKYGAPSPRRGETPPRYSTGNINRVDNPEDRSRSERCMAAVLPDFGGFRRIVQSPGSVAIFYDTGQGQGWQRHIPVDGARICRATSASDLGTHAAAGRARRWSSTSPISPPWRISWDPARTCTWSNAGPARGPNTVEYAVTIDDATTWTKPWTVKQEYTRQNEQANRIYYEPRCHEGNHGLPAVLAGGRAIDKAFAEGRGPDPGLNRQRYRYAGSRGRHRSFDTLKSFVELHARMEDA